MAELLGVSFPALKRISLQEAMDVDVAALAGLHVGVPMGGA